MSAIIDSNDDMTEALILKISRFEEQCSRIHQELDRLSHEHDALPASNSTVLGILSQSEPHPPLNTLHGKLIEILKDLQNCEEDKADRDLWNQKVDFDVLFEKYPLFWESQSGQMSLTEMMKQGLDVNQAVGRLQNQTLIHQSVAHGLFNTLNFLLQHGAHVEPLDAALRTPLHYALAYFKGENALEIVKTLLDHGSSMQKADHFRATPLHFALNNEKVEALGLFQERGFDLKGYRNKWGDSMLHSAVELWVNHNQSASDFPPPLLSWLVCQEFDLNAQNQHGYTAVQVAAAHGSLELVQFLSAQGADLKSKTLEGESILEMIDDQHVDLKNWLKATLLAIEERDVLGEVVGGMMEPVDSMGQGKSSPSKSSSISTASVPPFRL